MCNLPKQIAMEVHAKDMYMLYEDLTTREPVLDPLDFKHLYWTKHEVSMGACHYAPSSFCLPFKH